MVSSVARTKWISSGSAYLPKGSASAAAVSVLSSPSDAEASFDSVVVVDVDDEAEDEVWASLLELPQAVRENARAAERRMLSSFFFFIWEPPPLFDRFIIDCGRGRGQL